MFCPNSPYRADGWWDGTRFYMEKELRIFFLLLWSGVLCKQTNMCGDLTAKKVRKKKINFLRAHQPWLRNRHDHDVDDDDEWVARITELQILDWKFCFTTVPYSEFEYTISCKLKVRTFFHVCLFVSFIVLYTFCTYTFWQRNEKQRRREKLILTSAWPIFRFILHSLPYL